MRNIELKARLRNLDSARQVAARLATKRMGVEHQIDTYFAAPRGRLKLRQVNGLSNTLIAYSRSDTAAARPSDYHLVPVAHPETLKQALAAALGIVGVVDKRREIFLVDNVRIHLDEVVGLGAFLEFEAVLSPGQDEAQGYERLATLQEAFRIDPATICTGSYRDLLAQQAGP
ncbi:MAG: class IV adenylate cyclase [Pirellulales bacterium]|nr:class IV adenylate cyclase [Pirellulales bacterium]